MNCYATGVSMANRQVRVPEGFLDALTTFAKTNNLGTPAAALNALWVFKRTEILELLEQPSGETAATFSSHDTPMTQASVSSGSNVYHDKSPIFTSTTDMALSQENPSSSSTDSKTVALLKAKLRKSS